MQARGENDPNACQYNDIALVLIDPEDHKLVNPSVPTFGGPTGIRTGGVGQLGDLEPVFSYGNSVLRQGFTLLSPKYGKCLRQLSVFWVATHPLLSFLQVPTSPNKEKDGLILFRL